MPIVRQHPDFESDYLVLIEGLVARGETSWISILSDGVREVVEMLSAFPAAGAPGVRHGRVTLRKIVFPRGPYVAWYAQTTEDPSSEVWLLRLFHARQQRPSPRRARRPPGRPEAPRRRGR